MFMRKPSKDTEIRKFNVLTDSREQYPYIFPTTVRVTLPFGDYSVEYEGKAYYNWIIVERKGAVSELFQASGSERERFERELEKMQEVPCRLVLCEFDYLSIVNDQPPGRLPASSVYGSICAWQVKYNVPFLFINNRRNASNFLWKMFYEFVKHKILKY